MKAARIQGNSNGLNRFSGSWLDWKTICIQQEKLLGNQQKYRQVNNGKSTAPRQMTTANEQAAGILQ
jgi:hypothetical protein